MLLFWILVLGLSNSIFTMQNTLHESFITIDKTNNKPNVNGIDNSIVINIKSKLELDKTLEKKETEKLRESIENQFNGQLLTQDMLHREKFKKLNRKTNWLICSTITFGLIALYALSRTFIETRF